MTHLQTTPALIQAERLAAESQTWMERQAALVARLSERDQPRVIAQALQAQTALQAILNASLERLQRERAARGAAS